MKPYHIKKTSTNTSDHSPDKFSKETQIQQTLIAVQLKKLLIQAAIQYYKVIKSIFSDHIYETNSLIVQHAFMQQLIFEKKDVLKQ